MFKFYFSGKGFSMEGISDVNKIQNDNKLSVQENGKPLSVPVKTEPMPYDSVELSTKNKGESKGFGSVVALLAGLSVLIGAGTFGGVKLYDKYFQKLSCGIKKGEINDALYNFIKKNDPKGKLFSNKSEIMTINEKLTDENFLILKQLTKMKDESPWLIFDDKSRFSLDEITDLLTSTNEFNLKYLEQLAKKSEKIYGTVETVRTNDMLNVLKQINPDNEKVAGQLIDIAKVNNMQVLVDSLTRVNKDNVDIYQMLLSTRKKGGKTELSISDIDLVAKKLKKTKNPNCAELFLNAEKNDGTGMFRYSMADIGKLLDIAKEEKYETYKKLYDLKCTAGVESGMVSLVKSVSDDNIDLIEPLLTKKGKGAFDSKYVIFDNWSRIENILDSVDDKNKDIAKRILDTVDEQRFRTDSDSWERTNVDLYLPRLFKELSDNPKNLKHAEDILNNGIVNDEQTLNFQKFHNLYNSVKEKNNKYSWLGNY